MASRSRFDRISTLANKKTSWKIKVRLTRLWKSINSSTSEFKGYNMILLDDDKTHIHAFAPMDYVNGIDSPPEEGKVYIVSDFSVSDTKYSYSAVSNKKNIYFLKFTTMTKVEEDDEMIPNYKFELAAFNTLKAKVGDTKILTDLMGLVQNRLPMQSRNTATGPRDILMFEISDGSATVKVTVWADLAHTLNEELDRMPGQDNIIILTSCGITEYHEQLQASTLSPSKFYLNPDYDAVYNLRYRLNVMNEPIDLDDKFFVDDCAIKTPVCNLKEITDLRNSDLKEMDVICHVSVCSVEVQSKWWFYICDSCPREVSVENDNYKCECGKIGSYPDKRFKLPLYVTDPTETIQVFLFDREVRRLTSTNANSLIGQNLKEGKGDQYPKKLKAITGKNLTLTISLNEKNLVHGNTVYFATDVVEEVQTSDSSKPTQKPETNSHNVHSVFVNDSGNNDNAIDDTPELKPGTNKRTHVNDNGANKKNKSKIV